MNEATQASGVQPDTEAGLTLTAQEKPRRDPEAIAKYEEDYPDVVKDPVLAQLIAIATKKDEETMRSEIDRAIKSAQLGRMDDAEKVMASAVRYAEDIKTRTETVTKLYKMSKQLLDGEIPASTE